MSTRAVIARKTKGGWKGRYHHWDGYPSGLGQALWHHYHNHFGGDLEAMLAYLIDSDDAACGWSTIVGRDLALEPISPEEDYALGDDWPKAPVCYARRDASWGEEPTLLASGGELGWIEYLYVFDPALKTLAIYDRYGDDGQRLVAQLALDGPEPDWNALS